MILGTLALTIELYMTKYIIGESFISGGATLHKNLSDQTVYTRYELRNTFIDMKTENTFFQLKSLISQSPDPSPPHDHL